MRVLYIVTAFARYKGDVITPWLTETIKRLKNKRVDISVFVSSYKGLGNQKISGIDVKRFRYFFKKWENLTHEEMTVERIEREPKFLMLVPFYIVGGMIKIYQICKREKFEIIHVHWPFPHAIFGWLGKKVGGVKLVYTFYGAEALLITKKLNFLLKPMKWTLQKADDIIAISSFTGREIEQICSKKIKVIPCGSGFENIQPKKNTSESNQRARIPNILFVGRLVERKGIDYLIKAISMVRKEREITLTIVGEGDERTKLDKLVRDLNLKNCVEFTGFVSHEELDPYFRRCALFVLPAIVDSRGDTEGLGIVLLEAMSYQRPVIASNVGGIVDIVKDGKTGMLVQEKNPKELADAIVKILSDRFLANRLAKAGNEFVKNRFNWNATIDELVKVYKNLVKELR